MENCLGAEFRDQRGFTGRFEKKEACKANVALLQKNLGNQLWAEMR